MDDGTPVFEINFGGKGREARWNGEVRVRTANRRAEMFVNMRAWLERGVIPDIERLAGDLTSLEYGYNADSAIQLERKEHLRARGIPSSDYADALALTFAEHVEPREMPEYLNPGNCGQLKEYDRYADVGSGYDRYSEECMGNRP
jgi:hypothetical protein